MEEQLISYRTAKLAKAVGFEIPTKMCYGRYFPQLDFNNLHEAEHFNGDFSSYAPSQSLLQKWLRDNHQIVVSNHVWEYFNGKFSYNVLIWEKEMDDEHKHICPMDYESWEESLEVGLKYALGLINKKG